MIVPAEEARNLATQVLRLHGTPETHAEIQADLLLEAELRGYASHGLLRLPRIVERIRNGVADPSAVGLSQWVHPGFLRVDGQRGLGPVIALRGLDEISERARQIGIAVAAVDNSNHIGMLAWYAERIAAAGQIALCFSTSEALVHPWGGRRAMIGTNPIAIGVPARPHPFVMDMATSLVAMGKIYDHANRAQAIPSHWALDRHGKPTTDPEAAKAGAIAPFGDAKGYALGLAFELLVSALAGSALGQSVQGTLDSTKVCNKGDVFIVISPDIETETADELSRYLNAVRNCPPIDGFSAVTVPGDRSRASRVERLTAGISLPDEVWGELLELAGAQHQKRDQGTLQ
ncbi:Ldh family oxidoreductase [Mesorhizobium retamae]|uniref:Ldh family oxidoreductase n=1 Tax=Mesorhizobium retamae TaxID=2912854 RepID=A0ABS9QD49_9HYPH|nr:Ldh family oxidoreductase [Mesorhizobium sp. IRAMC:0171]MCG7505332.1 Ldh family oxidoreductase [Mesorhizobium sp. IRAMC:0171]